MWFHVRMLIWIWQPEDKGKAGMQGSNLFKPERTEKLKAAAEQGSLVLADKENMGLQSSLDLSESVDEVGRTSRSCPRKFSSFCRFFSHYSHLLGLRQLLTGLLLLFPGSRVLYGWIACGKCDRGWPNDPHLSHGYDHCR